MLPGWYCIANYHIGAGERRQLIPHVRFQVPFLGPESQLKSGSACAGLLCVLRSGKSQEGAGREKRRWKICRIRTSKDGSPEQFHGFYAIERVERPGFVTCWLTWESTGADHKKVEIVALLQNWIRSCRLCLRLRDLICVLFGSLFWFHFWLPYEGPWFCL